MNTQNQTYRMQQSRTHVLKNNDVLLIRPAAEEDTADVLEFYQNLFAEDPETAALYEESPDSFTMEAVFHRINRSQNTSDGLILTAWLDDRVFGIAECARDMQTPVLRRGRVGIGVLPALRGEGVGTALMYSLIGWARSHPTLELLTLSIAANNTIAKLLYEKMGFIEEGRVVGNLSAICNRFIDSIVMFKFVK